MRTFLLCFFIAIWAASTGFAMKLDPLLPGNRRVDMHETACIDNGGPVYNIDMFSCDGFECGDGTIAAMPQATPCKLLFTFGHCLNGDCLTSTDYLAAVNKASESI